MGIVIRFPDERRMSWGAATQGQAGPASVVILPVVRIERHGDDPGGAAPEAGTPRRPNRRKRARGS